MAAAVKNYWLPATWIDSATSPFAIIKSKLRVRSTKTPPISPTPPRTSHIVPRTLKSVNYEVQKHPFPLRSVIVLPISYFVIIKSTLRNTKILPFTLRPSIVHRTSYIVHHRTSYIQFATTNNPPVFQVTGPVLWPAAHHWEQYHAIRGGLP